uniref:Uncharacterized protein n=1 Tax=Oscillatoriales cyanobacterium SpSt-402 TaxID=2282168 RepID=A0A832H206_9CYAN
MVEKRTPTDSLADIISILVNQVQQMGEKFERSNAQLTSRIDDLAVQIGNQAQSIDRLERSIDRLTENVDRVNTTLENRFTQLQSSIERQSATADKQAENVAELIKLARELALARG